MALRAALLVATAGTVLASGNAQATGFLVARFGGEHGTPMTDDPTALYYNPAGIAFAHGTNIYVEGIFAFRQRDYKRNAAGIDHPAPAAGQSGTPDIAANSGTGHLSNILVSPFLGVTSDLGIPNLGVGLSVSVPFGGQQKWDKDGRFTNSTMYPGAADGAQRWSDIEGQIQSIYFTLGGAYKLPGNLAVGVAFNIVSSTTLDLRATDAGGVDDLVDGRGNIVEGRGLLDTTSIEASIGAGIVWAPTPEWRIGFSYQSQPGFGTVAESGQLSKALGQNSPSFTTDVEHRYSLPDVFRLGVSYRPSPVVELRLWGDFERWSVFTGECILDKSKPGRDCTLTDRGVGTDPNTTIVNVIPRYWQDAIELRASGSYWVIPDLELELGVGFDGNAVPDAHLENSLPDENKINFTVGAVWSNLLAKGFKLNVNLAFFVAPDRTVDPRPRNSDGSLSSPLDFPSRVPDSSGDYSTFVTVLTVGAGYVF